MDQAPTGGPPTTSTITTVATTTSSIVYTTSNGPHNVDLTPTTTSSYRPSAGMLYKEFAPTDKMLLTTSGPLELSLDIDLVANSEPTRTSTGHNVDLAPTVGPQTTSGLLYINIAATVSNNPNPRTTCGP